MNAAASVGPVTFAGVVAPAEPIVFVNGVPAPALRVERLVIEGPLDRRRAEIVASSEADLPGSSRINIALPRGLSDGAVKWQVLIDGRAADTKRVTGDRAVRFAVEVIDDWSVTVETRLRWAWRAEGSTLKRVPASGAALTAGSRGNGSESAVLLGRDRVRVIGDSAEPWRVGETIATVLAFARANELPAPDVELGGIPEGVAEALLTKPVRLGDTLGKCLEGLLAGHGLVFARELRRDGREVRVTASVVPAGAAKTHRFARVGATASCVGSTNITTRRAGALEFVARASGRRTESTFALVAGWNPAEESLPDSAYETSAADFARVSDVFRLWALNEDGAFSTPPFSRGSAFDLAAFFGEHEAAERARLLPCLVTDGSGRELDPVIEASVDNGATWFVWPGVTEAREDRAAVYLADAALPDTWLAAARAGEARVRVTASLRSANPMTRVRRRGNAFRGAGEAIVTDTGDAFVFQRVAEGSRHFAGVRDGTLRADERDDARELERWVSARAAERRAGDRGEGEAVLIGSWPTIRPGDRVILGVGVEPGPLGEDAGVVVTSVTCEWPVAGAEIRRGATTRVAFAW